MMFVAIAASVVAMLNNSILDVVKYILTITAGVGPVYILRWYCTALTDGHSLRHRLFR